MPIIAANNGGGTFTPHPEGQFAAVCADVHDLGMVEVTWQGTKKQQHKIDIYFYCGESIEKDGKTIDLMVRERFTLSLGESSKLRPFLEAWRGKAFTTEEERGFDVERLIGVGSLIQVTQREHEGKVYSNVTSIMRLPKQMLPPDIPADYVRIAARPPKEGERKPAPATAGVAASAATTYDEFPGDFPGDEDDLPF